MKKTFLLITLFFSFESKAQYFIPLFNETTDTMFSCNLIISDTIHNYLYLFVNDSSMKSYAYAYRNNSLESVINGGNQTTYYKLGCTNESGQIAIEDSNEDFSSIDSLIRTNCVYTQCSTLGTDAMASRNDTIYYNDLEEIFCLAPNGILTLIGTTSGGAGPTDLEFYNGYLYCSGLFTAMNGNPDCKYICWWDGVTWQPVNQTGIVWGASIPGIQAIRLYDNKFVGFGNIDSVNGTASKNIALFNGSFWQQISGIKSVGGGGPVYHGKLYFFGQIMNFNNNWYGFATYSSDSLSYNYNYPPFQYFAAYGLFNDTIFIGGSFKNIGYIPAKNLAKFVDNSFSSFATVGTKWWYNSSDNNAGIANSAYTYYEVTRDTFIMHTANYYGYNCRKITGEQHEHDSTVTPLQPLYVFGDTSRVMYYNNYRGRFVPLYNFNVSIGDTLTYYTPQPQTVADTTFRVVVDSITQLNVQGTSCKRVWSTPLDGWCFGNDGYVQLVGGMGSMLPQPINYYNTEGPLRCYEDTSVFYHYLVTVNCEQLDTTTGISEQLSVNSYQVSVSSLNENSIAVNILISRSTTAELLIYNMQGQLVSSKNISLRAGENHFTEQTAYAQGMYLLQVRTKSEVRNFKFVVQ